MRIKIYLETLRPSYFLPINYMYPLSAVVYKIFSAGSEEVAEWLHQEGFRDSRGKPHKLFNFSQIVFDKYKIEGESIYCNGDCHFIMSSPLETVLIDTFVNGIFRVQNIFVGNQLFGNQFRIKQVEILKPTKFNLEHDYRTLTPISLSTMMKIDGKTKIHYYRPNELGFITALVNNLKNKYHLLHKIEYNGNIEIFIPDMNKVRSKLFTIKEGMPEQTKVKAFNLALKVVAEPELHKTLYYCGLGEKNSMGFGMVELIGNIEKFNNTTTL